MSYCIPVPDPTLAEDEGSITIVEDTFVFGHDVTIRGVPARQYCCNRYGCDGYLLWGEVFVINTANLGWLVFFLRAQSWNFRLPERVEQARFLNVLRPVAEARYWMPVSEPILAEYRTSITIKEDIFVEFGEETIGKDQCRRYRCHLKGCDVYLRRGEQLIVNTANLGWLVFFQRTQSMSFYLLEKGEQDRILNEMFR